MKMRIKKTQKKIKNITFIHTSDYIGEYNIFGEEFVKNK